MVPPAIAAISDEELEVSMRKQDDPRPEERLQELERRRIALNQQLMNVQTLAEANDIERELWALRAEISYYKSKLRESRRRPSQRRGKPGGDACADM